MVEIVIDERGAIVAKTVLQSLGPKLDEKVLLAWKTGTSSRLRAMARQSHPNKTPFFTFTLEASVPQRSPLAAHHTMPCRYNEVQ